MREEQPGISGCCRFAAFVSILIAVACGAPILAQPSPALPVNFPRIPRSDPLPLIGVTLIWDRGYPPETTVSNLTTGAAIFAGIADAVMFTGLPIGSTNRFRAFNAVGSSAVHDAVATTQTVNNASISIYSYQVIVPVNPNRATYVMTSTNLSTWNIVAFVLSTNSTYRFLWTNDGAQCRFFRSIL